MNYVCVEFSLYQLASANSSMRILNKFLNEGMKKPHNYYSHKSTGFDENTLLQSYDIIEKIGEGAFGEVYKVFDKQTSQIKAVKKAKSNAVYQISKELGIMSEMSSSNGFAKITELTSDNSKNNSTDCVVMSYLGDNLGNLIQRHPINLYSMKRIGAQLIRRLQELHNHSYVHRDLKPENILIGNTNDPHTMYLVDFGLVSKFKKDAKKARDMYLGIVGTARFAPIASHMGLEQFPKDDLESIGYILIYLIKGKLPWKIVQGEEETQKYNEMKKIKVEISTSMLAEGLPCMKRYFTYIRTLKIDTKIDYTKLIDVFNTNASHQYCYEFCQKNCIYKSKARSQQSQQSQNQIKESKSIEKVVIVKRQKTMMDVDDEPHANAAREFIF